MSSIIVGTAGHIDHGKTTLVHALRARGKRYGLQTMCEGGGTANVIVCIASKPIGSPLIESPRGLIVMNLPSLEKFAPKVRPGGVIVVNQSLIDRDPHRDDCCVVKVPSRELAQQAGAPRAANFVMLGAYIGATGAVLLTRLVHSMRRDALKRGVVTLCIGGGQGIAVAIELV